MRRALALAAVACALGRTGGAAADDAPAWLRIAPSWDGHYGAWALYGPFKAGTPAPTSFGGPDVPLRAVATSSSGAIDVKKALEAEPLARKRDVVAYARGILHLAQADKVILLVGSDDGIRASVDGKVVIDRDEPRPQRDDDDAATLDLAAGDHPVELELHQRDGAWSFRARFVDQRFAPPAGSWLELPGVSPTEATAVAERMARGSAELGVRDDAYMMHVHAELTEGVPIAARPHVRASVFVGTTAAPLFSVDAGEISLAQRDFDVQLPPVFGDALAGFEDHDVKVELTVGAKTITRVFHPRKFVRETLARADADLGRLASEPGPAWLADDTLTSLQNARARLAAAEDRGDRDAAALLDETRELARSLDALEHDLDPYARRHGPMRMAYRSPADGGLSEYGLYVPDSYAPGTKRKYPLIVALHGMNGHPMSMMRWLFGGDDPHESQAWEDRHYAKFIDGVHGLDAFVVTPSGYGNTMYRGVGEDDVMRVLDRVARRFPIDPNRISITGPSMGGIGAAAIPFRHPDRFAAAEPLCGYHSYFVRRDIVGRPIRPWERLLAEERSNVDWAENGFQLPLFVVHGTRDLPVANSGVLIDRYEKLRYSIEQEHPDRGHDVWVPTYENLRGAKWLLDKRRNPHPRRVRFRTVRLRDAESYWVHVDELSRPDVWGEVDARVRSRTAISATTRGVSELTLDRDPALVDPDAPVTVTIDGQALAFDAGEKLVMRRDGAKWSAGSWGHVGPWKHGDVTGPIRDAFHAPLLFVWGASDPDQARVNEHVARAWARIRSGVTVHYPVVSDAEFFARGESLANDHALFLVGDAKSNRVVRALEPRLPIRVDGDAIVLGDERISGDEVGAAFIHPNPERPDRYIVVVEGTSALGTLRSLSLPSLLPDFVVWDKAVAPARGQMLLSAGALRAGGFFENDWSLPASAGDPLAAAHRPGAKSAHDATPYLP